MLLIKGLYCSSMGSKVACCQSHKVLKKKSTTLAIPAEVCAITIGPDSSPPGVKSLLKFDSQQLCYSAVPKLSAFKDLNPFQSMLKAQVGGSILRVNLALFKVMTFSQGLFSKGAIYAFSSGISSYMRPSLMIEIMVLEGISLIQNRALIVFQLSRIQHQCLKQICKQI